MSRLGSFIIDSSDMHPIFIISAYETTLIPVPTEPKAGTKNINFLHKNPLKMRGVFGPGRLVSTIEIP